MVTKQPVVAEVNISINKTTATHETQTMATSAGSVPREGHKGVF